MDAPPGQAQHGEYASLASPAPPASCPAYQGVFGLLFRGVLKMLQGRMSLG